MLDILDQIEHEGVISTRLNAKLAAPPSYRNVFLASFFVSPFLLIEGMFVPFLGQALALLALFTTFYYLRSVNSLKVTLLAGASAFSSICLLMFVPAYARGSYGPLGYLLLGSATFVSIAYIVGIGILIFKRHDIYITK